MDKLLELVFGMPWWLVLAIAVYGSCWAIYRDLPAHEPSRKRWIGYLAQNTWSNRYRKVLGNMLDWVDARLTPEISDQDWEPDEARAAWSHGLLNLSLVLAVVYPILSEIVYWAVTNRDSGIGSLVLIAGGEPAWRRAGAIGLLAGSLGAAIIARRAQDHMRWSDGSALFDLQQFFTDIRANPGHYWWLYFTLFSTLIPTVLHGAVAVFGTGIHLWPGLRRYIIEGLDAGGKGDVVKGRWAVRALCLSMTVSVVAPIFVLGHLVLYRGIFGFWLLDLFEGFARAAGAI